MIAIIGGTGLNRLDSFVVKQTKQIDTPFGMPSSELALGELNGVQLCFIARHGQPHHLPPHKVNYRANIDALKQQGVRQVIAVNAVGGIHPSLGPACLAIPDQIIDYTYGREHTFYDGRDASLEHVDFTYPYTDSLRNGLIAAAERLSQPVLDHGVYAATQGPRLESAAEVRKIGHDGGDMIGMTGMPEAALAREAGLEYACIALSVNWCAGMTSELITMEDIRTAIDQGMTNVLRLIEAFVTADS